MTTRWLALSLTAMLGDLAEREICLDLRLLITSAE
jgi:hypothetical protein